MAIKSIAVVLLTFVFSTFVHADTYVENFSDPFPAWETGWLGLNTNIQNYYTPIFGSSHGHDYLWITDGDLDQGPGEPVDIYFDTAFGLSLTSLTIDIDTNVDTSMQVYDGNGAIIFDSHLNMGVSFETIPVTSTNGISGFSFFSADQIEGSTRIDNVIASSVPVPAAAWLFGYGLLGLFGIARRKAV